MAHGESQSDFDIAAFQRGREAGDTTPLLELYDRCCRLAFGLAVQILGDAGRAEDVVERATLQLWRAPLFEPRRFETLDAWFLAHVHRAAIDTARTQKDSAVAQESPDDIVSTASPLEQTDVPKKLADERQMLELAYFDGLAYRDIAERLGISPDEVLHAQRHGLHRLSATKKGDQPTRRSSTASRDDQRRAQRTDRSLDRNEFNRSSPLV